MSFDGLVMTRLGKAEFIKATDEGSLDFSHIVFGDGITNELFNLKEELSHEVARLLISEVKRLGDRIILSVDYTNKSFDKGFYFREIGIIGNGKLCYYDNCGENAEYIDPINEVVVKEKRLRIELIVSETVSIKTTINGDLYALTKDVEELKEMFDDKIKNLKVNIDEIDSTVARNGYGDIAGGKNLAISYADGAKSDAYYTALHINTELKPSTEYTISFIGANGHTIYLNENVFNVGSGIFTTCTGERQSITATTLNVLPSVERNARGWQIFKNNTGNTVVPSFTEVQIELGSMAAPYAPYYPSNKMLAEQNTQQSVDLNNQQNNGYLKKNLVDYKSLFSDLTDNAVGTSHSYSAGELKIIRTANQYSGVYIYSKQITPLQGKDLIVSFDAKSSVDGMKLSVYVCDGGVPSITETLTSDYKRYRLEIKAGSAANNLIIYGNTVAGDAYIKNFMITEKYVEDTTYVDHVKSNAELDALKADKSEVTTNLLNPTLQSTTRNGVSVINNTDGTYSFKGTATDNIEFQIAILTLKPGQYKYFGSRAYVRKTDMTWVQTVATGNIVSITEDNPVLESVVYLNKGDSIDKTIPFMITANLYATTEDFVSYTGRTGSLNGDVADLCRTKADKSELITNLLDVSVSAPSLMGLTFTDNKNGTFSVRGTANNSFDKLVVGEAYLTPGTYKNLGGTSIRNPKGTFSFIEQDGVFTITESQYVRSYFPFNAGDTFSGTVMKPMITTNLDATIDDFVPYTGDTGTLNGDLAGLKRLEKNPVFEGSISLGRKANTSVGTNSVAMGYRVTASGNYSHAEGDGTTANGSYSHAEGGGTTANGSYSHAEGNETTALNYQHAGGHHNNINIATASTSSGTGTGTSFVIGNGTFDSKSNAFRVDDNGTPYSKAGLNTTGADYAEFFEWEDENPDNEDRRGYFVTLVGKKIKIAKEGDYIIGIVSGFPAIIGNGDEEWKGRYIFDDFGCPVIEEFEYEAEEYETITNDEGEEKVIAKKVKKMGTKWKEVPDYDPERPYVQRAERKEWSAVGMLGVLSVRDDGSCKVNGFCKLADGGIATTSDTGYRVVKRVTDDIVEVIFR